MWFEKGFQLHSFVPVLLVENTNPLSLNFLGILVENQLTKNLRVHFLDSQFYSIDLYVYPFFFLKLINFLAVLGLCCCMWAFSSCGKRGLLFIEVHRLLTVVASLAVEHGF